MVYFTCRMIVLSAVMLIGIGTVIADEGNTIKSKSEKPFKSNKEYREFVDRVLALKYNYRFVDEIVDLDGNIIPDVSVLSVKSKGPMTAGVSHEKFMIKDGKFDFSSKGVFTWGLTFKKPKYYELRVGMGVSNIINWVDSNDETLTLDGNTVIRKAKIILYPWGNLNNELLTVGNNVFTYSEESDIKKIVGLVVPYEKEGKQIRKTEEFQFTFTDEKRLPKTLIYIVPGRNKDGSNDGTIRLKTNIKDGGFLPVKYEGVHFFRSMWEAPETGYQPELIIEDGLANYLQYNYVEPVKPIGGITLSNNEGQPVKLVPKEVPYTVFYFKAMGRYGKGLIMPMAHDSKLEKNQASLRLYLYINRNPDIRNTNIGIVTNW